MRLIKFKVDEYKVLKGVNIFFQGTNKRASIDLNKIYGKFTCTVLVGENGSGKTTLLSLITEIFHNLQRFQNRIKVDFELQYEIKGKDVSIGNLVTIEKIGKSVFVEVQEQLTRSVLLEWDSQKGYRIKNHQKEFAKFITYEEFSKFLPTNVITSTFSIHGEFPRRRPNTFRGDQIVKDYSISDIYGTNHYVLSSLSQGIFRFSESYFKNKKQVGLLLNSLGLGFGGTVLVKNIDANWEFPFVSEHPPDDRDLYVNDHWITIKETELKKLKTYLGESKMYINDLELIKLHNGSSITLENMSSGEKMLFIRLLTILASIDNNSLVLIEEPELHLNPAWVKQLITILSIIFKDYYSHFIIASHNYAFINTLNPINILWFENGNIKHPDFNTLLANEPEIANRFFPRTINSNNVEIEILKRIEKFPAGKLEELLNGLGESFTKYLAFKKLKEKRD